jgi:hypothetical protein
VYDSARIVPRKHLHVGHRFHGSYRICQTVACALCDSCRSSVPHERPVMGMRSGLCDQTARIASRWVYGMCDSYRPCGLHVYPDVGGSFGMTTRFWKTRRLDGSFRRANPHAGQ